MSDQAKPPLNLVEPRGIGRCEMNMVARTISQPLFHFGTLVSRVVINHQMYIEPGGHIGINVLEKPQKFLVTMTLFAGR